MKKISNKSFKLLLLSVVVFSVCVLEIGLVVKDSFAAGTEITITFFNPWGSAGKFVDTCTPNPSAGYCSRPVPDPGKRDGYTFAGWGTKAKCDSSHVVIPAGSMSYTVSKTTVYYACWDEIPESKTCYSCGQGSEKKYIWLAPSDATGCAEAPNYSSSQDVCEGANNKSNDTEVKACYYYGDSSVARYNWTTLSVCGAASYCFAAPQYSDPTSCYAANNQTGDSGTPNNPDTPPVTTLYMVYNANGGSGAPATGSFTAGSSYTISSTKPTRTGYTFTSWNTNADGSGVTYQPGSTWGSTSYGGTLYAQWKSNSYEIKYDANGGSGAPATESFTAGSSYTISSTKPVKDGYTFTGWNTKADGTGQSYQPGSTWGSTEYGGTLYAQYIKKEVKSYKVIFELNDGTNKKVEQTVEKNKAVKKIDEPKRDGYTFDGWYTDKNGKTKYNFNDKVTKDITLYAKWTKVSSSDNGSTDTKNNTKNNKTDNNGWGFSNSSNGSNKENQTIITNVNTGVGSLIVISILGICSLIYIVSYMFKKRA